MISRAVWAAAVGGTLWFVAACDAGGGSPALDVPDFGPTTLSCDDEEVRSGRYPAGSPVNPADVFVPSILRLSRDGRHLWYGGTYYPADPEAVPARTLLYRMNLADYSATYEGSFAGPALTCREYWDTYASLGLEFGELTPCLTFGDGRWRAVMRSDADCWMCAWPIDWLMVDWCVAVPRIERFVFQVGIMEDAVTGEQHSMPAWWLSNFGIAEDPSRLALSYPHDCRETGSVWPGRNPGCPEIGGPCCRCEAHAECPPGKRCTGRTADDVRYCLPE